MANPAHKPDSIYSIVVPNEAITMDADAFDQFVVGKGLRFIHYRALKCPVGLTSIDDARRTHPDHSGCSNGFIFREQGRVTGVISQNATELRKLDPGFVDGSTIAVTFPRFYDSDPAKRVMVRPDDRFYLEEPGIRTATHALLKRRNDGRPDRPPFPAAKVTDLVDSNGQWWENAVECVEGDIRWKDGLGPPPGTVYSVHFEYQPYWYCRNLVHEIRVVPVADYIDTNKVQQERLAFAAVLCREFVHRTEPADDQGKRSTRRQLPPDEGGFDWGER